MRGLQPRVSLHPPSISLSSPPALHPSTITCVFPLVEAEQGNTLRLEVSYNEDKVFRVCFFF